MAYRIVEHKRLHKKARTHTVEYLHGSQYKVQSGSSELFYLVNLKNSNKGDKATCTCERQKYIGDLLNKGVNGCSHVMAVFLYALGEEGYRVYFRTGDERIKHLHRRTVRDIEGDNVVITARRDLKPRLPRKAVDDIFTALGQIVVLDQEDEVNE
jgi:predicted nucleic acid-binding Zn finger protein